MLVDVLHHVRVLHEILLIAVVLAILVLLLLSLLRLLFKQEDLLDLLRSQIWIDHLLLRWKPIVLDVLLTAFDLKLLVALFFDHFNLVLLFILQAVVLLVVVFFFLSAYD